MLSVINSLMCLVDCRWWLLACPQYYITRYCGFCRGSTVWLCNRIIVAYLSHIPVYGLVFTYPNTPFTDAFRRNANTSYHLCCHGSVVVWCRSPSTASINRSQSWCITNFVLGSELDELWPPSVTDCMPITTCSLARPVTHFTVEPPFSSQQSSFCHHASSSIWPCSLLSRRIACHRQLADRRCSQTTATHCSERVSEWVSSFLTAHKHNLGHLVPLQVKNQERKSNIITK